MFDLPVGKKEIIPYNYYTVEKLTHDLVSIDDILPFLRPPYKEADETVEFKQLLIEELRNGCPNFNVSDYCSRFDAFAYYLYYHYWDCRILAEGMLEFQKRVARFTGDALDRMVDIMTFYTIGSFGDFYFQQHGCYDGIYEPCGNTRSFAQESVRGGICYVNPKFEKKVIETPIKDYDAVSMYPSSMLLIAEEIGGYPEGPGKLWSERVNLQDATHYLLRIKITRIGKYQQIPFISKKVGGKMRYWNKGISQRSHLLWGR